MISSAMFMLVTICRPFHPGWLLTSTIRGPFGLSRMSMPAILHPTALADFMAMSSNSLLIFSGVGLAPRL